MTIVGTIQFITVCKSVFKNKADYFRRSCSFLHQIWICVFEDTCQGWQVGSEEGTAAYCLLQNLQVGKKLWLPDAGQDLSKMMERKQC